MGETTVCDTRQGQNILKISKHNRSKISQKYSLKKTSKDFWENDHLDQWIRDSAFGKVALDLSGMLGERGIA